MDRKNIIEYVYACEENLNDEFKKYEHISFLNSMKVLNAFHKNKISESHLNGTTGYGYNDYGRDIRTNIIYQNKSIESISDIYKLLLKIYNNEIDINEIMIFPKEGDDLLQTEECFLNEL